MQSLVLCLINSSINRIHQIRLAAQMIDYHQKHEKQLVSVLLFGMCVYAYMCVFVYVRMCDRDEGLKWLSRSIWSKWMWVGCDDRVYLSRLHLLLFVDLKLNNSWVDAGDTRRAVDSLFHFSFSLPSFIQTPLVSIKVDENHFWGSYIQG